MSTFNSKHMSNCYTEILQGIKELYLLNRIDNVWLPEDNNIKLPYAQARQSGKVLMSESSLQTFTKNSE